MKNEFVPGYGVNSTVTPLGLHMCNDNDTFFEPIDHQKDALPIFKSLAHCIDNIEDLEIWGNSDSTVFQALQVRLVKCRGRDTCKTDEEIDQFIDQNGHLIFAANEQHYMNERYAEDSIKKNFKATVRVI